MVEPVVRVVQAVLVVLVEPAVRLAMVAMVAMVATAFNQTRKRVMALLVEMVVMAAQVVMAVRVVMAATAVTAATVAMAETVRLRAMVHKGGGRAAPPLLTELKGVDDAYPLYGTLALQHAQVEGFVIRINHLQAGPLQVLTGSRALVAEDVQPSGLLQAEQLQLIRRLGIQA